MNPKGGAPCTASSSRLQSRPVCHCSICSGGCGNSTPDQGSRGIDLPRDPMLRALCCQAMIAHRAEDEAVIASHLGAVAAVAALFREDGR